MAIKNNYSGFSLSGYDDNNKRDRDSSFGELKTRDLEQINSDHQVSITNSYNTYNNRLGASQNYNTNELKMIQSMVTETININGITVRYMPRMSEYTDEVWNESPESVFDHGLQMDMLLSSVAGFEGEGDVMTQYGIEFREEVILKLSIPRFEELYGDYMNNGGEDYPRTRPLEGDLIVIPFGISSLNNNQYMPKIFEITRVTTYHDGAFFQMGDNYQYKIKCRLFELSYETISYTPDIRKQDIFGTDSDVLNKVEEIENNPIITDSAGFVDITQTETVDSFGDNKALEIASQEMQLYSDTGEKLKEKAKVITGDYTAKAFGYPGIITNLDDI